MFIYFTYFNNIYSTLVRVCMCKLIPSWETRSDKKFSNLVTRATSPNSYQCQRRGILGVKTVVRLTEKYTHFFIFVNCKIFDCHILDWSIKKLTRWSLLLLPENRTLNVLIDHMEKNIKATW